MNNTATTNPVFKNTINVVRNIMGSLGGGYILAYHQISPKLFESHIRTLSPDKLVPLSELITCKKKNISTKGLFAITVDDCYVDTLPDMCDICETNQWPVTFYPPVDFIDGRVLVYFILRNLKKYTKGHSIAIDGTTYNFADETVWQSFFKDLNYKMYTMQEKKYLHVFDALSRYLIDNKVATEDEINEHVPSVSWDFIAEKSANPLLSFQSHGITHQPVISLSNDELEREYIQSKRRVEEVTGKPVEHFCYPYGGNESIGDEAPKVAAKHFASAVTMNRGRIDKADIHMLPRIPLYNIDSPARTLLKQLTK